MTRILLLALAAVIGSSAFAGESSHLVFQKVRVGHETYEAASAFDVDNDGNIDIVSGKYWYAGPDFIQRHKIWEPQRMGEYYDDFSSYPMDVNGDGFLDIVTGGFWGCTLRWLENPKGRDSEWAVHDIASCGNIETTRFWDVDGDGYAEAVPNAGGRIAVYRLVRDDRGKGTGRFSEHVILESGVGHGIGFGDVNGDGRGDFIISNGWLEAPDEPFSGNWTHHAEFQLGTTSVPVLVHDVNRDGIPDIIEGQAHGYGLHWWEQKRDETGTRAWVKHTIDADRSQYHDLQFHDIDRDGQVELVTGKRYRAHNGRDPGGDDPLGVYYFEIDGGDFRRVTLDYGPADRASGVGIYFWVEDVDNNGWLDIVAPGKEGLFLFRNLGLLRNP